MDEGSAGHAIGPPLVLAGKQGLVLISPWGLPSSNGGEALILRKNDATSSGTRRYALRLVGRRALEKREGRQLKARWGSPWR